jgi:hydroxymethylbilane synthase
VVPVAGLGQLNDGVLSFEALIGDLDGRTIIRDRITGAPEEADSLGRALAERLLDRGGREILARIFGRPV